MSIDKYSTKRSRNMLCAGENGIPGLQRTMNNITLHIPRNKSLGNGRLELEVMMTHQSGPPGADHSNIQ